MLCVLPLLVVCVIYCAFVHVFIFTIPLVQIDNVAVICQRAQEHIHAGECILTYGYSKIIEQFLKAAGAKRKFQVVYQSKTLYQYYVHLLWWGANVRFCCSDTFVVR